MTAFIPRAWGQFQSWDASEAYLSWFISQSGSPTFPDALGMNQRTTGVFELGTNVWTMFLFSFVFLGLHLRHMEVPKLGVQSELQLPAYTTATAMRDPSSLCDLYHSSRWQDQIPKPLSKARDRAQVLMDASQVLNPLSHNRNSCITFERGYRDPM